MFEKYEEVYEFGTEKISYYPKKVTMDEEYLEDFFKQVVEKIQDEGLEDKRIHVEVPREPKGELVKDQLNRAHLDFKASLEQEKREFYSKAAKLNRDKKAYELTGVISSGVSALALDFLLLTIDSLPETAFTAATVAAAAYGGGRAAEKIVDWKESKYFEKAQDLEEKIEIAKSLSLTS